MASSIINIENVSKTYGKFKAIEDVTLKIQKGEIFGLIGPNGSGKTTIITILMGLLSADKGGHITIMDQSVPKRIYHLSSEIGYMPQDLSIYHDLTIYQNMDFFAKLYRIPKKIRSERIDFLLDLVKLSEFKSRLISKCSGGMRRRCSFAVALINDPKILILDEPTVGIDPELRNTFWDYFQDISKKSGVTILITTHYLAESVRCDRVGLIDKTIIKSGTPLQLQEQLQKENNLEKLPDMEEVFIYYTKKSRGDKN